MSAVSEQKYITREEWRSVVTAAGYEISSLGRLRSLEFRNKQCTKLRSRPLVMKTRITAGYETVTLLRKTRLIHLLVLEAFHGLRPRGLVAAHLDGARLNNQPSNLCWATRQENEAHKLLHGTALLGERNPRAKLKNTDIKIVLQRLDQGESRNSIARTYKVNSSVISAIARGVNWRRVMGFDEAERRRRNWLQNPSRYGRQPAAQLAKER